MNARHQLLFIWSGYAFFPLYAIGFIGLAGFVPLPSPNLGGVQIAAMFDQSHTKILIGMILCVYASGLLLPWSVAIYNLMIRIEAQPRILSTAQLTSGALGVVFFMTPSFVWATMAFRTGHSPEIMQVMNDFAWISWIISVPTYMIQIIAFAVCGLSDRSGQNLIPRWFCYLSIWTVITLLPTCMILLFKTGPFAWNGLIALYLPLAVFVTWYNATLFVLLRAVKVRVSQTVVSGAFAGV